MKNYIGLKANGMGFDAHLTVMYTGDLEPDQESHVENILSTLGSPAFYVERDSIVMFGPNNNIPVLKVTPTLAMWNLRKILDSSHIPSPSEFPWNPHITLEFEPDSTLEIPPVIHLNQLGLY